MILYIPVKDCSEQIRDNPCLLEQLYNLGIDYADHDITGYYEDEEYKVFQFTDYGIRLDNRWNTYNISAGKAGITIEILTTRKTL